MRTGRWIESFLTAALMAGLAVPQPAQAQSAFQEVAGCWASKVIAALPQQKSKLCILPCRNMAGLDVPSLQQLGQLLQGELIRQGSGRIELSSSLSTYDLEGAGLAPADLPAADYWVEPGAAFQGSNILLSAKIFSRSLRLESFAVCAVTPSSTEILLFTQPAPVIPAGRLEKVFESQPLPFRPLDLDVSRDVDGVTQMVFLDDKGIGCFELRDNLLLMKSRLELPAPEMSVRDLRGSIWIGRAGTTDLMIAQRACDAGIFAFSTWEHGWQPTSSPVSFVPFPGASSDLMRGGVWERGRNFLHLASIEGDAQAGIQVYAAAIVPRDPARLLFVRRDSTLVISSLDGSAPAPLGGRAGDAVTIVSIDGTPCAMTTYPGGPGEADGLRAIRLEDGAVLLETAMAGTSIVAIRTLESRLFVLASDRDGFNRLYVYEIKTF